MNTLVFDTKNMTVLTKFNHCIICVDIFLSTFKKRFNAFYITLHIDKYNMPVDKKPKTVKPKTVKPKTVKPKTINRGGGGFGEALPKKTYKINHENKILLENLVKIDLNTLALSELINTGNVNDTEIYKLIIDSATKLEKFFKIETTAQGNTFDKAKEIFNQSFHIYLNLESALKRSPAHTSTTDNVHIETTDNKTLKKAITNILTKIDDISDKYTIDDVNKTLTPKIPSLPRIPKVSGGKRKKIVKTSKK